MNGIRSFHFFVIYFNNIIVSGEAILRAENSGNLWAVGALPRTPLGSSQRSSRPSSWWGGACFPLPKNPIPSRPLPRLSALRASFGSPQHFRPMLKGKDLHKTLRKRIFLGKTFGCSENIRFSSAGVQSVFLSPSHISSSMMFCDNACPR